MTGNRLVLLLAVWLVFGVAIGSVAMPRHTDYRLPPGCSQVVAKLDANQQNLQGMVFALFDVMGRAYGHNRSRAWYNHQLHTNVPVWPGNVDISRCHQ